MISCGVQNSRNIFSTLESHENHHLISPVATPNHTRIANTRSTFQHQFTAIAHRPSIFGTTALLFTIQHMSTLEVGRKSISLDCDTIYFSDVLGDFRSCPRDCGCSFYFEDEGNKVSPHNNGITKSSFPLGVTFFRHS